MSKRFKLVDTINHKDPKKALDEYCKKILSFKCILARFLKDYTEEYKDLEIDEIVMYIEAIPDIDYMIDNEEILGLNLEDHSIVGAEVDYDILFFARLPGEKENIKAGFLINIEAQNDSNPEYPLLSRAVYYVCRILAGEKNGVIGFEKSEYGNIKKVYSMWICIGHPNYKDGVINKYTLNETCLGREWHSPMMYYDLITVVMIYPKKHYDYNDTSDKSTMKLWSILFESELPPEEIKRQLIENYDILLPEDLEQEVFEMSGYGDYVENKGMKRGLEQGEIKATIELTKKLMKTTNVSIEQAMDMLELPQEIRPTVIEKIKNQK